MATNFPTSLDSLTNPTSSDSLSSPSHAAQHANANDAIEALQTKVGVDSSADTGSMDYKLNAIGALTAFTPSYTSGVTVGNAPTNLGYYCRFNDMLYFDVMFVAGSTSSFDSPLTLTIPASLTIDEISPGIVGSGQISDFGVATYPCSVFCSTNTSVVLYMHNAAGTYSTLAGSAGSFSNQDRFNFKAWVKLS